MLIGHLRNENRELRHLRKLCWTILCGYADTAKLPPNESMWWPIAGEPVYRMPNKKEVKKIADKFRAIKWGTARQITKLKK